MPEVNRRWIYPTVTASENKGIERIALSGEGLAHEVVGIDGSRKFGCRPSSGFRAAHELDIYKDFSGSASRPYSSVAPPTQDKLSFVTNCFPVHFQIKENEFATGFVYRVKRRTAPTTSTDAAIYIDGGADGIMDIAADTAIDFSSSVVRAIRTNISDQGADADDAYTATADDEGSIIINAADDDTLTITLPSAVAGMCYTVLSVEAQTITIDVDGSDQIMVLTDSTGDSIDSAGAAGNMITLCAVDATEWYVVGSSGTWSDGD